MASLRVAAVVVSLVALLTPAVESRDPAQVALFRKTHACPSTGKFTGACPGWVVDHRYPLCAGGKDEPANMAWQDKTASFDKDRIERELCACKAGKR